MRLKSLSGALFLALILPATASANPEPTAYDTKSVSLGLTGVSYLERPAALAINPALLEGIDKFATTIMFNPLLVNQQAPVQGANSALKSGLGFGPIGSLFVAGRIAPRIVFGGGVYLEVAYGSDFANVSNIDGPFTGIANPTSGAGNGPLGNNLAQYPNAENLRVVFVVGEVALGPSIRINDKVNIGFALRIPFAKQVASLFQNIGAALGATSYANIKNDLTGIGFPSGRFGISYRPIKQLWLGVSYRPYVKINMSGSTVLKDPVSGEVTDRGSARASWSVPHALQFGGAVRLLEERLMIILEGRLQWHNAKRTGNEDQTVDVNFNSLGAQGLVVPFDWRNVWSAKLGVEYALTDFFALRGGVNAAISATTKRFAQYFTPPPGINWFVSYGAGFNWDKVDFDVGGAFAWGGTTLDSSVSRNPDGTPREVNFDGQTIGLCSDEQVTRTGCPGKYTVVTYWVSLSMTYHL